MDLITSDSNYLRDSGSRATASATAISSALNTVNHRSFTSYSSDLGASSKHNELTSNLNAPNTSRTSYDKYGLDRYSTSAAAGLYAGTTATNQPPTTSTAFTNHHHDIDPTLSSSHLDRTTDGHLYRSHLSASALEPSSSLSYHPSANVLAESSSYKSKGLLPTTTTTTTSTTSTHLFDSLAKASSSSATIIDKYTPSYMRDLHHHSSRLYEPLSSTTNGVGSRSLSDLPTTTASTTSTSNKLTSTISATAIEATSYVPGATTLGGDYIANNRTIGGSNPLTSSVGAIGSSANLAAGAASRAQSGLGGGIGGQNIIQQLFDDMRQIEDTVDSIEIPARGRCKVFMAKYGYDPYKQSPNENPDNELAFNAGDYIMVFDDMDEDGYFIGELMDGRRGYVPSNWLDRLTGEDLFDFQATVLYNKQNSGKQAHQHQLDDDGCGSESNSYPPEFYDAILTDTMQHSNFQHLLAPEDYRRMNDYVDLDDVDEVDDECLSDYERAEAEQMRRAVPPPQKLLLERQLNKSILISWLHPEAAKGTIISYQVYVDGVLKSTVPSGDRTKALLEGVDSTIPHRISVRAIDLNGRHSNDAGCTIVIGQRVPFAPSCVKASHITSDSALISWLPCNSNFHHVVAVNSVEVQTVRPGVYKHLINGLSANTLYRVWVRAKPGKILSVDEKNPKKLESLTTYVDFKTMPKSLPDPPVNVQVEAGPQRRTLLVTWLPLTLNNVGSSNGCPVTGYAVFAGHKKLADIDSPTGDHALLDLTDLESLHKKSVTVRTKSGENLSQDSMSCQIPDEYLKNAGPRSLNDTNQSHHHHNLGHSQQQHQIGARTKANSDLHNRILQADNPSHGHHSPSRHASRYGAADNRLASVSHMASPRSYPNQYRSSSMNRGRQMARSLQNLESDLDSRRSSIPAIEITRDANRSDYVNFTESYSEEEFENSMRFRGVRDKSTNRANSRYRPRRYYSIDSNQAEQARAQSGLSRSRAGGAPERDVRYFVALFDYDPSTMSPNPNAANEELAFKEGSIIKVIGDKGPDGFYRGELDNHVGFVPCNVVSEITDPNLLYNLHEKSNLKRQQQMPVQANLQLASQNYLAQQQSQQPQNIQQQQQQQQQLVQQRNQIQSNQSDFELQQQQQQQQPTVSGVKRMVALYDYNPQENSPNVDTESEIPFKVGDVIYVYGKMDTDGFYIGEVERTKQKGLVPSNFLREEPLPINAKGPMTINSQQGQQLLNQMNSQVGNMAQMMDPMQQQRAQNQAFQGGLMQAQQQQPGAMMEPSMAFNQQQQQQGQIGNPQMRANIRGMTPAQQNISRPTTLSLGSNFASQQGGGNMNDWNQRQQMTGANQMHDMQSMPQQSMANNNQHPQQGGVLSNLLSSGKQIINAATPRMPNQPGQFPQMNQAGASNAMMGGQTNMGNTGISVQGMAMGMAMGNNDLGGAMMDSTSNFQATAGNRANMMQAGNLMQQQPQQQQQQQQQHQPMQQFNQMGFNRGPMNQAGGEDQGGNILNTVKNMFKL